MERGRAPSGLDYRSGPHHRAAWYTHLLNAGWRPLSLDELPAYFQRHKTWLCGLLLASIGILAGWICAHQVLAPDIGQRSIILVGAGVIPQALVVIWATARMKPSLREYLVMCAIAVAYGTLEYLFSLSSSDAVPFVLSGTCVLFLILSSLMMRLRPGNAVIITVYFVLVDIGLFVEAVTNELYDIVLMDCEMPVLDGLESTRLIRRLPGRERLPIIALSAHGAGDRAAACSAAGMSDWLSKPIGAHELREKLLRWL